MVRGERPAAGSGRYALHPRVDARPGADSVTRSRAGAARETGRFLRPQGPFTLASHLPMSGAADFESAVAAVVTDWRAQAAQGHVSIDTVETYLKVLATLRTFMTSQAVELLCDVSSELLFAWVNSLTARGNRVPTQDMRSLRSTVARTFYLACFRLGYTDQNPAAALSEVRRPARYVCSLTEDEVVALKRASDFDAKHDATHGGYEDGSSKAAAAVALALLGAQSGEVGAVRCTDVRLTDGLVWAHGGGQRYVDRWLPIDDGWAFEVLVARVAFLARQHPGDWADRPVAYSPVPGGNSTSEINARRSATSMLIGKALERAGLKQPGRIRVASINEYVAARVLAKTGRIEAVAARLGMRSLDAAAHVASYDWRPDFTTTGPSVAN